MDGWDGLKAFQIKVPLLNHLDERMTPIQMNTLVHGIFKCRSIAAIKITAYANTIQVHAHTMYSVLYSHQAPSLLLNIVQ